MHVLKSLDAKISQNVRRVLIVEDNDVQRDAVAKLIGSPEVETICAATAAECLALLREQTFDCMVLDLSLPDASGYALLETISQDSAHSFPPVIVYTGRVLTTEEEQRLRRYSKSIIIKGAKSPERCWTKSRFSSIRSCRPAGRTAEDDPSGTQSRCVLEGRRIPRGRGRRPQVYALTNILEPRGALVEIARNGEEGAAKARTVPPDDRQEDRPRPWDVMMPIMDGLTATRHIRKMRSSRNCL